MKTITINLYSFNELSDEAKKFALKEYADINTDHDWWDWIFEDTHEVGLKCDGFDLDRGSYCKLRFINSAMDTMRSIIQNHGENSDTYLCSQRFRTNVSDIDEDDEEAFEEYKEAYLKELCNCYLRSLREEYDYIISDEAIIDTFEANDYHFESNGKMNNRI